MKTILLGLMMTGLAAPAAAQNGLAPGGPGTQLMPWAGTSPPVEKGIFLSDIRDTPTMRRQKQVWAISLRDEALRLQAEDGGILSDHHARYIQRRIDRLLR